MRNLKYIILLFALGPFIWGCNKDFLNREPLDTISQPDFWKTTNDLELYANSLYPQLGKDRYPLDGNSDNIIGKNANTWMNGQNQSTMDVLKGPYSNIRKINIMIANMDRVTDPNANQYKGEAYFLRAWQYFAILKNVGAAQLVTVPLNSEDNRLFVLRSPRDSVADFIILDLDKAISLLTKKSELRQYQRISKDAALAFKSRVALFEGSWEKYHNGTPFGLPGADYNKFFKQAADAAKTLIDDYGYTLDDDYQWVFKQHTIAGSPIPVKEIIFARQFSHLKYNTGTAYGDNNMNVWPNGSGYTRSAIGSYLCTDGLPISRSSLYKGDTSLANIGKNRDPRLNMTVFKPGAGEIWTISAAGDTTWFVNPFINMDYSDNWEPTGYSSLKFYTYDLEQPGANRKTWDHITIYFRYGEVLLNYAEAKAELGQFDQAAAQISIDMLRSRASVHMPPLTVGSIVTDPDWPDWGYSLSPLLQEIRRERRVELMGEGFRFDDLRRWAAVKLIKGKNYRGAYFEPFMNVGPGATIPRDADNYLQPLKNSLPNGYQFDPKRDYLLPFPMDEITLNPKLTQNPGW